jgi:AcrR family transcriptional regulator
LTTVSSRTAKAEQTREAIVDAALHLFRERGFEQTTMRAVAAKAGVSLGNAYYYYGSKQHLVQEFYGHLQTAHAVACSPVLAQESRFAPRLLGVLEAWIEAAEPYHEFAGTFFQNAAQPSSPLSPFSAESGPTREASIALLRETVEGSDLKLTKELRAELPDLLWLAQMGIVLFWVHDTSDDQRRTRELARQIVPLIDQLARLTRLPVVRGIAGDVVDLVRTLRPS